MLGNRVIFTVLSLVFVIGATEAKKKYNEECSLLSQVGNLFTSDKNDSPEGCDTDKGLLCITGRCMCTPPTVYEEGIFGFIMGGECKGAANTPCLGKDAVCVSNAACGADLSICRCFEGYHFSSGYCTNGSMKISASFALYTLGLLLSYFVLGQH